MFWMGIADGYFRAHGYSLPHKLCCEEVLGLTSVFHLSLTNRKTSYSSSSSFSVSSGETRTGISTIFFSTAIKTYCICVRVWERERGSKREGAKRQSRS